MNFKLFALVILSLASVVLAGPTTYNKIDNTKDFAATTINTPAAETLKQWCQSSQMSQPELTQSFKKLVGELKQQTSEQLTDAAVINSHLCQSVQDADMNASELVKDVYMDALSACDKRECMKQLVRCIDSGKVDKVRANYYMTRLAVNDDKSAVEQKEMIQELSESFSAQSEGKQQQSIVSKAIQRQKMFAVTANLAKQIQKEMQDGQKSWQECSQELKQTVERVLRAIVSRFVKPVSSSDVEEYKQKAKTPAHLAEKIAERNAALKAIANIPGHALKHIQDVEQVLIELAKNKQELSTVRQSAIEALEQNEKVESIMIELALHQQDEPTEVRVAAYRCLMTCVFADSTKDEQWKQSKAQEIIAKILKHVESQQAQQQDDQFVLYVISHLENLRTSENPDHAAIKDSIHANKQHHMQISVLNRKFKHQLQKFGKSSRNYQLDQTFDKIESGLVLEGDIVFDQWEQQQQNKQAATTFLPKLVRVNVSLPILGQTVNVIEVSMRQDNMEQEFIKALRPLQDAKFSAETIEKVVGEFKQQINEQQQHRAAGKQQGMQQQAGAVEADIAIKVDGCTVVYLCADDMKATSDEQAAGLNRKTRSINSRQSTSALEDILEQLKRNKLSFNRGFHFDINKRIASVLDVEAHLIGGLLLDSRVSAQRGAQDFEVSIQMEPRVSFEAIVGPAASSKRLLQRASTKTAIGMRLRYKQNELVDIQIDLPMNEMELFKFESQMVEKKQFTSQQQQPLFNQYSYLEDSIYGQEDIYTPEENTWFAARQHSDDEYNKDDDEWTSKQAARASQQTINNGMKRWRKMKRSIFEQQQSSKKNSINTAWEKLMSGKQTFYLQTETSEHVARATGLRSKLNIVASQKDLTFLASWIVKKYEPAMQGYRVQVQQQPQHDQYIVVVSTPGSRVDRNMQLRVMKQSSAQRTMLKTELSSQLMNGAVKFELVHDAREFAIKLDATNTRTQRQVLKLEAGVQQSSQSGKIATTYKPYLLVQAADLKRPLKLEGLVSYQQSPKTVITYELKTAQDSTKFVQGKFILATKRSQNQSNKRNSWNSNRQQRSMQSPWEIMTFSAFSATEDATMTNEIVGQWKDLIAFKQNIMIEKDASTIAFDITNQYKTKHSHKTEENRLTLNANYGSDRRSVHVEHRCSSYPGHSFRFDSQFDSQKKQEIAKFTSKSFTAQLVADWQAKKVELVADKDGRRFAAVQGRFERQGELYHLESVAQYKSQPLAKISAKIPAMLVDEPSQFMTRIYYNTNKQQHYTNNWAIVEFDGVVYQPTQAQVSGKIDLQKNELYALYKTNERDQQYHELKLRFDEQTATCFVEAIVKTGSSAEAAKAQAKINLPGLLETFTSSINKNSSWKKSSSSWTRAAIPASWMKQQNIEPSEIVYQSRDTQMKAKLVPRNEFTLYFKGQRVQHESRIDLSPATPVYKLKSNTIVDGRQCRVDVDVDVQQLIAQLKAQTQQSSCIVSASWPAKKLDMSLDVDGVRVLSHQTRLDRSDKFYNLNSNVDYYQQPYASFSSKVPSMLVDEPSSIFDSSRMSRYSREISEINFNSKQNQWNLKVQPSTGVWATIKTPSQQHAVHFEMDGDKQTDGSLTLKLASANQYNNYKLELELNKQQEKTIVKFANKRTSVQLIADLQQEKLELIVDCDGRRIVSSQNRFERQGDHYAFEAFVEYKNQPWAKLTGKLPAMLVEEPAKFIYNLHHLQRSNAVCEFDAIVYKPVKAQVSGKIDLQKREMFAVYKNAREQEHKELKARFDEQWTTLYVEAYTKQDDAKLVAKINMPGLIEPFTSWINKNSNSSWKSKNSSSWRVPAEWMKQQNIEQSEIVYTSRDTQMKAKLVPSEQLTVTVRSDRVSHESRATWNKAGQIFKWKSESQLDGRHCNAEIELDTQSKMATLKADYKQTQWVFVADLEAQKAQLFVDVQGKRVIAHTARIIRDGKFYTINSQIDYQQQPYAHIACKIPTIYLEKPEAILDESIEEQTEISYESRDAELKLKYKPGNELVAFAKTQELQHQSRVQQMQPGVYKLNARQSWNDNRRDYEIEAELNKPQQKSLFKAYNKPTGQRLVDWSLNRRLLAAF